MIAARPGSVPRIAGQSITAKRVAAPSPRLWPVLSLAVGIASRRASRIRAANAPSRRMCAARMPPSPKIGTSRLPPSACAAALIQPLRPHTVSSPKATMRPGVTIAEAKRPTTSARPGKRRRLSAHASAIPTTSDSTVDKPAWIAVIRSRCAISTELAATSPCPAAARTMERNSRTTSTATAIATPVPAISRSGRRGSIPAPTRANDTLLVATTGTAYALLDRLERLIDPLALVGGDRRLVDG